MYGHILKVFYPPDAQVNLFRVVRYSTTIH